MVHCAPHLISPLSQEGETSVGRVFQSFGPSPMDNMVIICVFSADLATMNPYNLDDCPPPPLEVNKAITLSAREESIYH